jgi:diguanylate cyclase
LNTLKIDQSFVRNVQEDPDDAAIVSAIIAMANSLNLDVIAEGIETEAQLNYLASIGCNKAQGYLLGKPLPAEEFTQFFIK